MDIENTDRGVGVTRNEFNRTPTIGIVGTGQFASALAARLHLMNYQVLLGSRSPGNKTVTTATDCDVTESPDIRSNKEIANLSDVVIAAVRPEHYQDTMEPLKNLLAAKIVIDVSNASARRPSSQVSNAETLQALLPDSRVVKAFNVISAYALETEFYGGGRVVYVCGNDGQARSRVHQIVRDTEFVSIDCGGLKAARKVEQITLQLFPGWGAPLIFSFLILVVSTLSLLLKFYWVPAVPKYDYNQLASMMLMLAFGFAALNLLACVYLPAAVASFTQLLYGTKHKMFPAWLDLWMKSRKHLGIITLAFSVIHGVLALTQYDLAYLSDYYYRVDRLTVVQFRNATDLVTATLPVAGKMNWKGETMLLAGTIALILMSILGVTSLPSVTQSLSWREWTCVQSYLGFLCFLLSVVHVVCMGGEYWQETAFYETNSWNVLLFPFLVVLLRIVSMLPCISIPVAKIRRGWVRGKGKRQAAVV